MILRARSDLRQKLTFFVITYLRSTQPPSIIYRRLASGARFHSHANRRAGLSRHEIARALGVTRNAVSGKLYREGGAGRLAAR